MTTHNYVERGDCVKYTNAAGGVSGGYVLSTSVLYRLTGGRTGSILVELLGPVHARLSAHAGWTRCTILECFPDLARMIRGALDDAIDREGTDPGIDSLPPAESNNEGEDHG